MGKCNPHRWKTPQVGDEGLRCQRCGCDYPFVEIPAIRRERILKAVVRNRTDVDHNYFREIFYKAQRAAIQALDE